MFFLHIPKEGIRNAKTKELEQWKEQSVYDKVRGTRALSRDNRYFFVKKIWSLHFSIYIDISYIIRSEIECRF
jgi:hypothetical protein